MKPYTRVRKWAVGLLLTLAVFLVVRLVLIATGVWGVPSHPASSLASRQPASGSQRVASRPVNELARYDPVVRLALLKELVNRPLPELGRNPFEFEPTPQEVKQKKEEEDKAKEPPPPPPPPPIPFKAVGYDENKQGGRTAYLTDDQDIYVVREGEEFAQRFKVLKITASMVEVADETYHQTAQLPYAQ